MVGAEGADNAKIRKETGIPSHQQVYLLTQEYTCRGRSLADTKAGSGFSTRLTGPLPVHSEDTGG